MKRRKVKVVRVSYGIFGRTNNRGIEKAIGKWMNKGFELSKKDEHPPGCSGWGGYTSLVFIEREEPHP